MQDPAEANDHEGRGGPVGELLAVVPRLVRRTRSQTEFVLGVLAVLPCPLTGSASTAAGSAETDSALDDGGSDHDPAEHELVERTSVLSVLARDDRPAPATDDAQEPDAPPAAASTGGAGGSPAEADLAVPDYDSLAASQVVPRLATLSPQELTAVAQYERAHRGRQTILNRVAQLVAD